MRFWVSDEVGLLKDVRLIKPVKPAKETEEQSKNKTKGKPEKTTLLNTLEPLIKTYGNVDRDMQIQHTCLGNVNEIIACYKNGNATVYSTENGEILKQIECFKPQMDEQKNKPKLNKRKKQEHFIGLHYHSGTLISGTDLGNIRYQKINDEESGLADCRGTTKQDNLFKMRVHNSQPNLFITGGDEKDLILWDINSVKASEKSSIEETVSVFDPVWKAKNVAHDNLDMRQPVWITDLQFLDPIGDHNKIVVGTGYGQIRLYDIKNGNGSKNKRDENRPCFNITVGEFPIKSLAVCPDQQNLIFSDNQGGISTFDIRNQKIVSTFKGNSGAISDIKIFKNKPLMAAVGLDRFLRVWETKGKTKLIHKVYLKQQMTSLIIDEDFVEKVVGKRESDDAVWKKMTKVKS